jgi:hypothetical protein
LLDAIVGPGQYRHRIFPFVSRRPFSKRRATPFLEKSLLAESLSPRRAQKARPGVYAEHWDGLGLELPHEMSYPTVRRLQYAVTHAQESGSTRPHVPSSKHCNALFQRHRGFTGRAGLRLVVDTDRRAHRIVPTCRPEKAARFVFRAGCRCDRANARMAASRNIQ